MLKGGSFTEVGEFGLVEVENEDGVTGGWMMIEGSS